MEYFISALIMATLGIAVSLYIIGKEDRKIKTNWKVKMNNVTTAYVGVDILAIANLIFIILVQPEDKKRANQWNTIIHIMNL